MRAPIIWKALREEADAVGIDGVVGKTHANGESLLVVGTVHIAHSDDGGAGMLLMYLDHQTSQRVGDAQPVSVGLLPSPLGGPMVDEDADTVALGCDALDD